MGEAPDAIRLVESAEDVEQLQIEDPGKVSYLMQTTLAVDESRTVVDALGRKFPALTGPSSDDICYATTNRQNAIRTVASESDVVLVIGSANSSNSVRLVELATRECGEAHLIDDESGIEPAWLIGKRRVGITAGASAPPKLVERVVEALGGLGPVSTEERSVVEESVEFSLPKEVSRP
jgi:4-hydroxy-3-methylbut-2-enyl diphosphate reductase